MIIVLDRPYSLGDLSSETYPHCYASKLVVDGRQQSVMVTYEFGHMAQTGAWTPTPIPTGETIILTGEALIPFFYTRPTTLEASLWDQTETIVYQELQSKVARLSGSIDPDIKAAEVGARPKIHLNRQLTLNFAKQLELLDALPISNTNWSCY